MKVYVLFYDFGRNGVSPPECVTLSEQKAREWKAADSQQDYAVFHVAELETAPLNEHVAGWIYDDPETVERDPEC